MLERISTRGHWHRDMSSDVTQTSRVSVKQSVSRNCHQSQPQTRAILKLRKWVFCPCPLFPAPHCSSWQWQKSLFVLKRKVNSAPSWELQSAIIGAAKLRPGPGIVVGCPNYQKFLPYKKSCVKLVQRSPSIPGGQVQVRDNCLRILLLAPSLPRVVFSNGGMLGQ